MLCICAKSIKSIVLEILAIILLSVILPALAGYLSMAQTYVIGNTMGDVTIAAFGIANNAIVYARGLTDVSVALCLAVCGMSISEKILLKRGAPTAHK